MVHRSRPGAVRPGLRVRIMVALLAASATLLLAGCGSDGDSSSCRVMPTSLRLEPGGVEWFWWEVEPPPLAELALVAEPAAEPAGCLELEADISLETGSYELDPAGASVALAATPGLLDTGIHRGSVTVRARGTRLEASAPLTLRVWRRPPANAARKALVVGVDGLRGDGIPGSPTPRIDELVRHARFSFQAATQLTATTVSAPGWTSISTGVEAARHRVVDNGAIDRLDRRFPSLMLRAKRAGRSTAAGAHWTPVVDEIFEAESMDVRFTGGDPVVAGGMAETLRTGDHDLHFLHLDDVDAAGHTLGFSTRNPTYRLVIGRVDGFVGDLVDAILERPTIASEDWLIAIVSDHGGEGTEHGALNPENRTIPLVFAGPSVEPARIPGRPSHMDVHPTVLDFLGVPARPELELDGSVVPLR